MRVYTVFWGGHLGYLGHGDQYGRSSFLDSLAHPNRVFDSHLFSSPLDGYIYMSFRKLCTSEWPNICLFKHDVRVNDQTKTNQTLVLHVLQTSTQKPQFVTWNPMTNSPWKTETAYRKRPNKRPGRLLRSPSGWRGGGTFIKTIYELSWYIIDIMTSSWCGYLNNQWWYTQALTYEIECLSQNLPIPKKIL